MTDDIVARARSKSPYLQGSSAERLIDELATEIERLRLRVKFLEDELKCPSAPEPKP